MKRDLLVPAPLQKQKSLSSIKDLRVMSIYEASTATY